VLFYSNCVNFFAVMIRYLFLTVLAATASPLLFAEDAATVTAAVNQVTHGSSKEAQTAPAQVGTKLQDGEYLKTGVQSRAELQLANQCITRLGANTIFDYSTAANDIDLQAGTILFSKPKDEKQMNIKTTAVTAAILGTTGFVQVKEKKFIFGLVEGNAMLTVNGVTIPVGPGQILTFTPGSVPQVNSYNVPHFLQTSPLFIDYHDHLPNQPFIDHEVAVYNDQVNRGFVTPGGGPPVTVINNTIPGLPILTVDSVGSSHHHFNMPPPPPPPTPPGMVSGLVENPAQPLHR
jgi:hypothetical protein